VPSRPWSLCATASCCSTDVYLPELGSGTVILVRTCYDKSSWLTFLPLVAEYVTRQDYVLVAQDVRGKGRSEGESFPFVNEVDDGYDTLEWVSQQPWCDGKIAMFGDSYFAYTAWAALASGHPALGAIVSRGIATDIANEVVYRDGTFMYATNAFWAPFWLDADLYDVAPPLDWGVRPLSDIISHWLPGRRSTFFDAVRDADPDDPFWQQRCFTAVRDVEVTVPVLHVGGWWRTSTGGRLRTGGVPLRRAVRGNFSSWTPRTTSTHRWPRMARPLTTSGRPRKESGSTCPLPGPGSRIPRS
jgi:predicted acyl esterase